MSNSSLRELFGKLLNSAGHMFWEIDRSYTVIFANEQLIEKFGNPVGTSCHEFMSGSKGVCKDCPVKQVFNGAERAVSERMRYDKEGNEIWLEHTATPIRDEAGNVIGASELTIDITQHKKTQEWVKDSERLYRNLVEQIPDIIFSLDSSGLFTFVNIQAEKFLGQPVAEILEKKLGDFIVKEDKAKLDSMWTLKDDEIWDEELAITDAKGVDKFARIRCKASFGNGTVSGYDGVMRDRTVRRKLEEELRASKQALVEKIRIIDELYEHIVQSGKCKAIEEHTAEVAHELRQPLAIVGGFARRMARQFESGEVPDLDRQRQYTSIIVSEIQRLEKILDRLIDFTKRDNLKLQKINPNGLIEYILAVTENRIKEKHIRLKVNLGAEISDIPVDPGRFQQLILNLLSNAIEASPLGGTIDIETGVSIPSEKALKTGELASPGFFEMKIRNAGPTIPPEALQNVFNPFFTTKQHGTGLGLTVSKKTVEDHRGSISVKSDEEGTVFTIWLPLNESRDHQNFYYYDDHPGVSV